MAYKPDSIFGALTRTAGESGLFRLTYVTRFGEARSVSLLSYPEALKRADVLRQRGYYVVITPMFA